MLRRVLYGIGLPRTIENLPSWVPDFTHHLPSSPGDHLRAGIGDFTSLSLEPLSFNGPHCTIQVYIVDIIESILEFQHVEETGHASADNSRQVAWHAIIEIKFTPKSARALLHQNFAYTTLTSIHSTELLRQFIYINSLSFCPLS